MFTRICVEKCRANSIQQVWGRLETPRTSQSPAEVMQVLDHMSTMDQMTCPNLPDTHMTLFAVVLWQVPSL